MAGSALPAESRDELGERAVSEYRKWRHDILGEHPGGEDGHNPSGKRAEPGKPGSATSDQQVSPHMLAPGAVSPSPSRSED